MKTINIKSIIFKKYKDKYQCIVRMDGYEFSDNLPKGCLIQEILPLFEITESELFQTSQKFIDYGYDIEVM